MEIDEGRTGTPGGDCAPGTPGNENISLTDGNVEATPGYKAVSASCEPSAAWGTANDGTVAGIAGAGPGKFATGRVGGAAGIVPRAG